MMGNTILAAGITATRNGPSTLLRVDRDEAANGTIDGHLALSYDVAGNADRWRSYDGGTLRWVQKVATRDTRGNPLLVELDRGANGSVELRSVYSYGCWTEDSFQAPDPVQRTLLQSAAYLEPNLVSP
jgi:hypothetical protein